MWSSALCRLFCLFSLCLSPLSLLAQVNECSPYLFANPVLETVWGDDPVDALALDLDGQNGADIALLNAGSDQVSVFLNRGDGTFDKASYGTSQAPRAADSADFDGDGTPDLAIACEFSQEVCVFLNLGDGSFAPSQTYSVPGKPRSIATRDFDQQNGPDLAVAGENPTQLLVLFNDGAGGFEPPVVIGPVPDPWVVRTEDLDGENGPDLVVTGLNSAAIRLFMNQGDGTFNYVDYTPGWLVFAVAIGDVDGMNGPDLVGLNGAYAIGMLNQGDGSFVVGGTWPVLPGSRALTLEDLDGQQGLDIAAVSSGGAGRLTVLLNQGGGDFSDQGYSYHRQAYGVAAADFTGDGSPDLVLPNWVGGTAVLALNQGDGTFRPGVNYELFDPLWSVRTGDLDGDGDLDVSTVISSSASYLQLWLNDGDGDLVQGEVYDTSPGNGALAMADFDGDSYVDVATAGDVVSIFLSQGDGTLAPAVEYCPDFLVERLEAADLDGASGPDLVALGYDSVRVLLNLGDGTFLPPMEFDIGGHAESMEVVDLDGSNGPDVVLDSITNGVVLLFNQGDGSLGPPLVVPIAANTRYVAAGDVDGQNGPDLAVGIPNDNELALLLNQGNGTFEAPVIVPVGQGFEGIHSGSLDEDGRAEFVVREFAYAVALLRSQETGILGDAIRYEVGFNPADVTFADLNGDECPDILVASELGQELSVILQICRCEHWKFSRGDCNGDGSFDLADVIFDLLELFASGDASPCADSCDSNDDGERNVSDATYSLAAIFSGGPLPPTPFPDCDRDSTSDDLPCESPHCP